MEITAEQAADMLKGMIDSAENTSRSAMTRFGYLPFTAVGHREHGGIVPVVVQDVTEHAKPQIADAIRQIFRQNNVVRYVTMIESWWAKAEDAKGPIIPPSERPDRKEVIMLVARDNQLVHYRIMLINRDPAGKFSSLSLLEDFPPSSDQPSMVGIFADLLPSGALYTGEPAASA